MITGTDKKTGNIAPVQSLTATEERLLEDFLLWHDDRDLMGKLRPEHLAAAVKYMRILEAKVARRGQDEFENGQD